jgi:hypothetical protein
MCGLAAKQAVAPTNDRATATTAIREFIMTGIPAELSLNVNIRVCWRKLVEIDNLLADLEIHVDQ